MTKIPFPNKENDQERLKINKESVLKFFPKEDVCIPPILGYESPINVIYGQMRKEQEDNIFKAVQEYGVNVDKDELIKALRYDRDQYEKGYIKGFNARASEVITEFAEEVKFEFYREFDEIIPSIMADKIEELKKKYIGKDTNVGGNTEET